MIVKDKQKIYEQSEVIANKILKFLVEECKLPCNANDPAEQIYLLLHTIARMNVKSIFALEGYAKIYGIGEMDKDSIHLWIDSITQELMNLLRIKEDYTEN